MPKKVSSKRRRSISVLRSLKCNRPQKSWKPEKKKVVLACITGRQKIIHYGAVGYGHNYSPDARRRFRARHRCDTETNKFTARYWACKDLWSRSSSRLSPPSRSRSRSPSRSRTRSSSRSRSFSR